MLRKFLRLFSEVRELDRGIEYLRDRVEELSRRNMRLMEENNKLVEHVAILNGKIARAWEILDRQRTLASGGEL